MNRNRNLIASVAAALCLSASSALLFRPRAYMPYAEGRYYFAMANGDYTKTESYYASRVLHPLAVHAVAALTHSLVDWRTFLFVSAVSLIGLFCILGLYFGLEHPVQPWIGVLLIATATVIDQYRNYYWHDLFYAMLCAAFFLTLRLNRWASVPILVLLFLTRESSVILVAVVVLAAAVRRQWMFSAAALGAGIVGFVATTALVRRALPNHHGIPVFLLDLLKIPYNFALNVCGLEFWTNTNAATIGDPVKKVANLPPWLHLGNIHQVGYCGFFWQRPAEVLVLISSAFGMLPLLVLLAFVRRRATPLLARLDYATALAYGGLMFILTPLTGTLPARYVLYAWPAFWIFGAALFFSTFQDKAKRLEFVFLSLVAAWVPAAISVATGNELSAPSSFYDLSAPGLILSIVALALLYVRGFFLVSRAIRESSAS